MTSRLKKLPSNELLIAIASAVFGLMIGPLLERIFYPSTDTIQRVTLVSILLLSIIVVIAIIILGKVHSEISIMSNKLGLTVRFMPTGSGTGEVYRAAKRIIQQSQKGIVFLHHVRPKGGREHPTRFSKKSKQERGAYIDSILSKVKEFKKEGYFYRRIYQLPDFENTQINEELIGSEWLDHTKSILELLENYKDAATLKKSPVFFEQSFIIVDNRYIFWPIDAVEPETNFPYSEGTFLFDDPDQVLVDYLMNFFNRVDANSIPILKL